MQRMWWASYLLSALALAVLQASAEGRQTNCLLPSQKPMVLAELFFGRDIEGRSDISDKDWASFVDSVVASRFPNGFTVLNGKGAWRDRWSDQTRYESSKVVMIAALPSASLGAKLQTVADTYRRRFHQQSVGIVTAQVCGTF